MRTGQDIVGVLRIATKFAKDKRMLIVELATLISQVLHAFATSSVAD